MQTTKHRAHQRPLEKLEWLCGRKRRIMQHVSDGSRSESVESEAACCACLPTPRSHTVDTLAGSGTKGGRGLSADKRERKKTRAAPPAGSSRPTHAAHPRLPATPANHPSLHPPRQKPSEKGGRHHAGCFSFAEFLYPPSVCCQGGRWVRGWECIGWVSAPAVRAAPADTPSPSGGCVPPVCALPPSAPAGHRLRWGAEGISNGDVIKKWTVRIRGRTPAQHMLFQGPKAEGT